MNVGGGDSNNIHILAVADHRLFPIDPNPISPMRTPEGALFAIFSHIFDDKMLGTDDAFTGAQATLNVNFYCSST